MTRVFTRRPGGALLCAFVCAVWSFALTAGCDLTNLPTEYVVTIRSFVRVDVVEVRVRQLDYSNQTRSSRSLGARDLSTAPMVLLLKPSELLPEDQPFLLHVVGKNGTGARLASASVVGTFDPKKRVEVELFLEDGTDNDDDGFVACSGGPDCDCDDNAEGVNPFTAEVCGDGIDNNCSGIPRDEGCPCNPEDGPVWCSNITDAAVRAAVGGVGACHFGRLECVNNVLGTTCDSGLPLSDEIAENFIDDDCDGSVDEGSPCDNNGETRACHRGFIDDPSHPDASMRTAASDLVLGRCAGPDGRPRGVQTCTNHRWSNCVGDVLPQFDVQKQAGFAERPPGIAGSSDLGQCNGIDDDCDGSIDEEDYYDVDNDDYTICGTWLQSTADVKIHSAEVDCDDSNADIHPGAMEMCGTTTVDEDCRCDHDDLDRDETVAASQIGEPSVLVDFTQLQTGDLLNTEVVAETRVNCLATNAHLNCDTRGAPPRPRSDMNPIGVCLDAAPDGDTETPGTYYIGYFGPTDTDKDCYLCQVDFGYGCDTEKGTCTTKQQDCGSCVMPSSTPTNGQFIARPVCQEAGPTGCTGNDPPDWVDTAKDTDPNGDCGSVSCTLVGDPLRTYYAGVATMGDNVNRCFEMATKTAAQVDCREDSALDLDDDAECETHLDVCGFKTSESFESQAKASFVPHPGICQQVQNGTCAGTTAPVFENQADSADLFDECTSSFTCDNNDAMAGGGPFYREIADTTSDSITNPQCFYAADVTDATHWCSSDGDCHTRAEACNAQTTRGAAVPGKPECQFPNGGCTGTTAPTFANVTADSDPYSECSNGAVCNSLADCGGNDADCGTNSNCDNTCISGQCANLSALTGPCDGGAGAEGNNDCTGAAINCSSGGVCGGNDATCANNADCVNVCIGVACNSTQAVGGSCDGGEGAEGNDDCTAATVRCSSGGVCGGNDAVCATNSDCQNTCLSLACNNTSAVGGSCDTGGGSEANDDCTGGTVNCSSAGVCGGNNAACTSNGDCQNNCATGGDNTCGGNTATCANNADCINVCIGVACNSTQALGGSCDGGEGTEGNDDCTGSSINCNSGGVCGGNDATCTNNAHCVNVCIGVACNSTQAVGGSCDAGEGAEGNDDCTGGTVNCSSAGACGGNDAACTSDADCVNNCATGGDNTCGGNTATCADNADCTNVCIGVACSSTQAVGGSCDGGEGAEGNDDCTGATVRCSSGGVCGGVDAVCAGAGDCDSGSGIDCSSGNVCGGNDATCANDADCVNNCSSGLVCGGNDASCSADGECVNNCGTDSTCGGVGAACSSDAECDSGNDVDCPGGGGVCGGLSATCQNNADCNGTINCNGSNVCGGTGASCSTNSDCVSNNCSTTCQP